MLAQAGAAIGVSAVPLAIKAVGEIHQTMVLQSNVLARQGEGVPDLPGNGEKLARQRAAGIKGGVAAKAPKYMGKVPTKSMAGDLRKEYEVGGLGNTTSSQGNIADILAKVPKKLWGTEEYKRIHRRDPSRAPGFGNQSFTP